MKEDWIEVELGEIASLHMGQAPHSRTYNQDGNGELLIKAGDWGKRYPTPKQFTTDPKTFSKEGDVLICVVGATSGKINLGINASITRSVAAIRPSKALNQLYLFFYKQSIYSLNNKLASGSAQGIINKQILFSTIVPLAPLIEQQAIVNKIEALFSSLDSGIADLKKAQEQLKIYRQAVLKKAFEGDYETKTINEVVEKVQIGPFGSQLHKADYITNGIPLINPMHIQNGKIKPKNSYSISIEKRNSLPNYILQKGDVIMGRRGEMGRSALVTEKEADWFCGTGSLFLRANSLKLLPNYLNKYLQSATVKEHLTGSATGTTMMNLNKKIISNLPIPIPSLEGQHQIVQEIESRLSVCDAVEQSISESLDKAQALRQSILKKAFEGKLLTQEEIAKCKAHPDYEPASMLLDRIKKNSKQ